ncbi:MAG: head GIN domain-containing protein [Bacteroidota bacterium]|nr:head GIN domain-containing protein [Bacteroidota bacterium]MDP4206768.1 head GIN domain-containing protein [Bacteroidota bacterium]
MRLLALTSFFFLLGMLISRLWAAPVGLSTANDYKAFKVNDFNKVYLEGGFNVVFKQGAVASLAVHADEANMKELKVFSDNGELHVVTKKNNPKVDLIITARSLEKIKVDGGIKFQTEGLLKFNKLSLEINGGAKGNLSVSGAELNIWNGGGCLLELDGGCTQLNINVEGAGKIKAENLKAKNVYVKINGAGVAHVYPVNYLDARIEGVGKIGYKGTPKQISKSVSGLGVVSQD